MKVSGNLIVGVLLISLGTIFLLGISNFWPFLLILLGMFLLSKRELTISLVLITLGVIFLISEFTGYDVMNRFWPMILIVIGASLVLKNFRNSSVPGTTRKDASLIDMSAFLSQSKQRNTSQNFKGGKMDVLLGEAKLDLSEAKLVNEGAKLSVSVLLGSVKIVAPKNVVIESLGTPVLGDWENEYRGEKLKDAPVLTIDGSAILGEVKIV